MVNSVQNITTNFEAEKKCWAGPVFKFGRQLATGREMLAFPSNLQRIIRD